MRTVARASDLKDCPQCGSPGLYHPAGLAFGTAKPFAEYWLCNGKVPCEERGRVLSWKSTKQWAFLHDKASAVA